MTATVEAPRWETLVERAAQSTSLQVDEANKMWRGVRVCGFDSINNGGRHYPPNPV